MPGQRLLVATSNILLILSTFLASGLAGEVEGFSRNLSHKSQVRVKTEKLTHFRLYWHDVVSGPKPTSVPVVKPANVSTFFGAMNMIDNPLTQGPDISSKLVGKAQGFYAVASQEEVGLLMSMNFAFSEGKYNGSTIAVLGRNVVMNKVREMPVIGGTGLFRFARGYVEARTSHWDPKTGDATVQYDCYVLHY